MNDRELVVEAKQLMIEHQYDDAIKALRQVKTTSSIIIEMELLVIEHEANYNRAVEGE